MFQSNTQEVLQKFIGMVPFPVLGNVDNYKIQYAIDEASESFLRERKPAGKYIHKSNELFFVDETLLDPEQKELFRTVPRRALDLPYIFILVTDSVKKLPIKLEVFYTDENDYSYKRF
jgi:hypothetical protein